MLGDAEQREDFWEASKEAEHVGRPESGTLVGIARTLPSLTRAIKLSARAVGQLTGVGRDGESWRYR